VIAGNHDHPKRLGALASLLEGLRIHVRPEVRPPEQGGVVRVPARDGKEEARVAVLPFVPERRVVDACAVMDAEHTWYEAYAGRIEQILAALVRGLTPDTVNVVLGHLLVAGARAGTGERELHLGSIYGVNPQQLPSGVQYIGLGHLHRPQEVLAPAKTLYSGSLVELDFGEEQQEKSVVVFEAAPGKPPAIEIVPVTAGRRLRTVEAPSTISSARPRRGGTTTSGSGEGRRPGARPRRARQGAPPERPRRRRRSPAGRRRRRAGERPEPRGARAGAALRGLLPAPPPGPAPAGAAAALRRRPRGGHAVRPLRLSVEGFTSFRDRLDVDFSGLDLFAITGPTGAASPR